MERINLNPSTVKGHYSAFEVCRQAADVYLNSGKFLNISARGLYNSIEEITYLSGDEIEFYNPHSYSKGPFIVDVRTSDSEMPNPYYTGHIPGAIYIPWYQITKKENLEFLPTNKQNVGSHLLEKLPHILS